MKFSLLDKKHPLVYSFKKRLLLSVVLSFLVIFILIFLKPFDTGEKHLPYKNLMLTGFGFCILTADLTLIALERVWVFHFKKNWTVATEFLYLIGLFLISSVLIYLYDLLITKQTAIYWDYFPDYSYRFILPFALLLLPLMAYLRVKYGEKLTPQQLYNPTITLTGQNKEDFLQVALQQLLCIKAEDNYVRVIYLDDGNTVHELLMRSTLAAMAEQARKLVYCHRSYLVAPWQITALLGHKQKASVVLKHYSKELPLSSAHYSSIYRLVKQ